MSVAAAGLVLGVIIAAELTPAMSTLRYEVAPPICQPTLASSPSSVCFPSWTVVPLPCVLR